MLWNDRSNSMATSCPADELVFSNANNVVDCGDGNRTAYYTAVPAGNYYLPVLVDPFSGSEGPYTITVSATDCIVGVFDTASADWQVYPNPTEGRVNVRSGSLSGPVLWELLDASGRVVFAERTTIAAGAEHVLDLDADMASGTYVLRATHAAGRSVQRVVLQ